MGKIIWVIVAIVVVVALYNTFSQLKGSLRFESLSSIIRLPGGVNIRATSTISVPTGTGTNGIIKNTPPPSTQSLPPPASVKTPIVPPAGFSLDQLSPFYSQVKISSVSQWGYSGGGQISLKADYSLVAPINITNWQMRSNKSNGGDVFVIPKAASDPSFMNVVSNQSGDIILGKSDYINIYEDFSPIGMNLRLNKCTGYLNSSYKFSPSLPNNCPVMYDRSEISIFSSTCQNLITSLWNCSVPSPDQINSVSGPNDNACRAMLSDRFNYNGCYKYHHNDADFFSNEWRAWLGTSIRNIDWSHDRLMLLDKNNLVVDVYIY